MSHSSLRDIATYWAALTLLVNTVYNRAAPKNALLGGKSPVSAIYKIPPSEIHSSRGRVVMALDLKSNGFESCRLRDIFPHFASFGNGGSNQLLNINSADSWFSVASYIAGNMTGSKLFSEWKLRIENSFHLHGFSICRRKKTNFDNQLLIFRGVGIIQGFTHVQEIYPTQNLIVVARNLIGDHNNKPKLVLHSSREDNDCFQVRFLYNWAGVSGNFRSRPFPRVKASDSRSWSMGMDFFIPGNVLVRQLTRFI